MSGLFVPLSRAVAQMDDRVMLGVVFRSVLWSIAAFAALHAVAVWVVHRMLAAEGWLAWVMDLAASFGATLLAIWFFVPIAAAIASLYVERIARAVERRWYPDLPPAPGAPLAEQIADGAVLTARLLGLGTLGLVLLLAVPGIGALVAWVITGYALGRGLFVAVAMRRMTRPDAARLYRRNRGMVMTQGMMLAVAGLIPVLNLFVPVLAVAAMVHVLDMILSRGSWEARAPSGQIGLHTE